jgi:hypothetical protein
MTGRDAWPRFPGEASGVEDIVQATGLGLSGCSRVEPEAVSSGCTYCRGGAAALFGVLFLMLRWTPLEGMRLPLQDVPWVAADNAPRSSGDKQDVHDRHHPWYQTACSFTRRAHTNLIDIFSDAYE